jgi:opacity protein-like surface antigen
MTNYVNIFRLSAARVLLTLAFTAAVAAHAHAQTESPYFIDLHAAAQVGTPVIDSDTTFTVYDETAAVGTRHEIGTAAAFDFRVGYKFRPRLGAGFSFSGAQTNYRGAAAARIPNPVFVDRPRTVAAEVEDLNRRELGFHLQVLYFLPVMDKVELTLAIGPSFVVVNQPVIAVEVVPGTQDIAISVPKESGIVPAINVGADLLYTLTDRIGVGVYSRFLGGARDFDSISNVSVTSVQIGGAVRVKF